MPPSFYWAPRVRQSPSPVPLPPEVLKVHLWPPLPQPLPWLRSHHLISAVAFHPASLPPGSLHPTQPSFAQGDSAVVRNQEWTTQVDCRMLYVHPTAGAGGAGDEPCLPQVLVYASASDSEPVQLAPAGGAQRPGKEAHDIQVSATF